MKIFPLFLNALIISSVLTLYLPLHNGIYTASAGYTVTIQLGTPPQQFEVQVDTGSTKLAVGSIDCPQCQQHHNPSFDYRLSSSFQDVSCSSGAVFCDDCGINPLGYNSCLLDVSYQDGGWIKGKVVSDLISLPGLSQPVRASFGCASSESSDLITDTAVDGIWGVGKSMTDQNGVFTRVDQLMVSLSSQFNSPRLFSLCLALQGGAMNIGTVDNSLHTLPGVAVPYDDSITDSIAKSLSAISLGNTILTTSGSSDLPQLIIDSGSTSSVFSQNIYTQIISHLKDICSQLGDNCQVFNTVGSKNTENTCFNLSESYYFSQFPPISFTFNGSPVLWHAEQYLYQDDDTSYCISFNAASEAGKYVLGDDFMLNKDIVFGESTITIYQQSKCSGQVVSYQYIPNPQILNSQQTSTSDPIPNSSNSTSKVLFCLGLTVLLAIFVIGVAYCLKRPEKAQKDSNPEDIIDDGVGTDVRFNQQMVERKTVQ